MASSKKPACIVETELVRKRKRRRSDLVIMWQSIWIVTSIILQELWMTILRIWEFIQMLFSSSEKFQVLTWLQKYLPYAPDDFSDSWRDGRLLAILINKLKPGCFPEAHELDPNYGLRNVYKVFDALETYFGIRPNVSVEEIITCSEGSDIKLFEILLELKRSMENQQDKEQTHSEIEAKEDPNQSCFSQSCVAKGTGLSTAFLGRVSNFVISCSSMSDLDVVIEIRGQSTICSERITKRSPKKKCSLLSWESSSPITRSASFTEDQCWACSETSSDLEERIIPLEYEITGNKISFSYKPKENGKHKLTILWHGQHILNSPYFIFVEDLTELSGTNIMPLKSALKSTDEGSKDEPKKNSVGFRESQVKYVEQTHFGKVLNKKVLGYVVKINGKYVPVNVENTESLAAELLRMDYDFENCSSSPRRNSWGFTGDAERRKSVIRQFGVDEYELEAQASQRRSRSLSISCARKKKLDRSGSYDNIPLRLKIVEEHAQEFIYGGGNEEDYAFSNEDVYSNVENTEVRDDKSETIVIEEKDEELTINNIDEAESCSKSFDEMDIKLNLDRISALSTNLVPKLDNLYEDSPIDFLQKVANSNSNILHKDEENHGDVFEELSSVECDQDVADGACTKQVYEPLERSKSSNDKKKIMKKRSKKKKHQTARKCFCSYLSKKYYLQLPRRNKDNVFYENISKNKNSILNEFEAKNEYILDPKKAILSNNEQILFKPKNSNKHNADKCIFQCSDKNINILNNNYACDASNLNNLNPNTEICAPQSKSDGDNRSYINITKCPEEVEIKKLHKSAVESLEDKKTFNDIIPKPFLTQPEANIEGTCVNPKPLKTHTLKNVIQFSFKQFSPPTQFHCADSPVRNKIKQWEHSLETEKLETPLKIASTTEISDVNVKEKLVFWENTTKTEQKNTNEDSLEDKKICNTADKKCINSQINSNATVDDIREAGRKTNDSEQEDKEATISINQKTNNDLLKQTDIKITAELHHKSEKRSFSDPGLLDVENIALDICSNSSNLESSGKEHLLCSSNDDNIDAYHSEGSSSEYFHVSSEDEYIDDEIPDSTLEYWGNLGVLNNLKLTHFIEDYQLVEQELQYQQTESFPEVCKVFGIAAYYGYVAIKNRFQVYTGNAGFGNLSVNMKGLYQHDVTLVSVAYVRQDIYEVTYQVMTAGYYLISIRWMDKAIPGSPFVCKVTF